MLKIIANNKCKSFNLLYVAFVFSPVFGRLFSIGIIGNIIILALIINILSMFICCGDHPAPVPWLAKLWFVVAVLLMMIFLAVILMVAYIENIWKWKAFVVFFLQIPVLVILYQFAFSLPDLSLNPENVIYKIVTILYYACFFLFILLSLYLLYLLLGILFFTILNITEGMA